MNVSNPTTFAPTFDPRTRWWEKIRNSLLTPTFLWRLVVTPGYMDDLVGGKQVSLRNRVLSRLLWFWPRAIDAQIWMRDYGDPSPYRVVTPDSRMLIDHVAERATSRTSALLDIGCNCGRHLAALADMGFVNLSGVDINPTALAVMSEWFPQLKGKVNIRNELMQTYLLSQPNRAFDTVFTRGATVELVHPSFPLVRELCRVAAAHVILMIQENAHSYPRLWSLEFLRHGFALEKLVRPVQREQGVAYDNNAAHTLLIYRRI